jgi:hypothetical protein
MACLAFYSECRLCLKCDGTRAETRFRLSAKRTSTFKSAGASVQSIAGRRGVRVSGSNAGYATFRGSVKSNGYILHSQASPSLPLPCVTVCHHISTGLCSTVFLRGGKRPLREAERSPPSSAEFTIEWRCTSTPQCKFTVCV